MSPAEQVENLFQQCFDKEGNLCQDRVRIAIDLALMRGLSLAKFKLQGSKTS